ncbi:hypothetical protein ACAW74_15855 [Fibrella sp. WM1]|uniref:hypothetical protein n=1 Tax=Fibrella musci TaxID=3242485 RepID=UPI00352165BB
MNILILGGIQAYGPGLPDRKSYVGQLIRRLRADGYAVQVDQYGPLTLPEAATLLSRLKLYDYDYLLLQLGDAELQEKWPVRYPISQPGRVLGTWLQRQISQLHLWMRRHQTAPMRVLRHQLATVLMLAQPYRNRTLMVPPLPQRRASSLQQTLTQSLFLDESRLWGIPCFDVASTLNQESLLFQTDTTDDLNELAHELLGSALHTQLLEHDPVPPPRWRRPSTS